MAGENSFCSYYDLSELKVDRKRRPRQHTHPACAACLQLPTMQHRRRLRILRTANRSFPIALLNSPELSPPASAASAPNEKPHERLFVIFISSHAVIIDRRFAHNFFDARKILSQHGMVALGDFVWLGEYGGSAFHIQKPHRAAEGEFQF